MNNNDIQKILIIDDDKTNLSILSQILEGSAQIILAISGQQGIEKAIEFQPDLILLDVTMPDMDGFEVITRFKNDALISSIPVIFVTGKNDNNHEEKGLKLGAADYIYKPFNIEILKARISLHLQLARQRKMLETLANIDSLTAIANRRLYNEVAEKEWKSSARTAAPLSLAMIDIDYFKLFNDHYGHALGDDVLKQVAGAIDKCCSRPRDFVARYGGEEFVVVLPDTDKEGAQKIFEACRAAVETLQISHEKALNNDIVTISLGAVTTVPKESDCFDAFVKIADDKLYLAKEKGRNCVVW